MLLTVSLGQLAEIVLLVDPVGAPIADQWVLCMNYRAGRTGGIEGTAVNRWHTRTGRICEPCWEPSILHCAKSQERLSTTLSATLSTPNLRELKKRHRLTHTCLRPRIICVVHVYHDRVGRIYGLYWGLIRPSGEQWTFEGMWLTSDPNEGVQEIDLGICAILKLFGMCCDRDVRRIRCEQRELITGSREDIDLKHGNASPTGLATVTTMYFWENTRALGEYARFMSGLIMWGLFLVSLVAGASTVSAGGVMLSLRTASGCSSIPTACLCLSITRVVFRLTLVWVAWVSLVCLDGLDRESCGWSFAKAIYGDGGWIYFTSECGIE